MVLRIILLTLLLILLILLFRDLLILRLYNPKLS